MTWQVLEGKNRIPVTLFEAQASVDSGPIYAQTQMELQGHELVDELRALQAEATVRLCQWWVQTYPVGVQAARVQQGPATVYPRRRAQDSRLDPGRTLAEQFNLLRVVDNHTYPAFFDHNGVRYVLRIEKDRGGA
jgi:methionyl-tRNA formyltransferase